MPADPIIELFAGSHPADVAKRLASASDVELNKFLNTISPANGGKVLAKLDSPRLRSSLATLEPLLLGSILQESSHDDSLLIIAHLENSRYAEIVQATGDENNLSDRLYAFSDRTVGSIAGPDFVAFRKGKLVKDVIIELDVATESRNMPIYATNAEGALLGQVPAISVMLRKNENLEIEKLSELIEPLNDRMTASAALESPQWLEYSILPVVDIDRRLVGTVTRKQLMHLADTTETRAQTIEEMVTDLTSSYLSTCANLLDLLVQRK